MQEQMGKEGGTLGMLQVSVSWQVLFSSRGVRADARACAQSALAGEAPVAVKKEKPKGAAGGAGPSPSGAKKKAG